MADEVEFQSVILKLSEHTKSRKGVEFDKDEALALLQGFAQMSENISQAADIIEAHEAEIEQLKKKRKLWRPGG